MADSGLSFLKDIVKEIGGEFALIDKIVKKAPPYRLLMKIKPGITSCGQVKLFCEKLFAVIFCPNTSSEN